MDAVNEEGTVAEKKKWTKFLKRHPWMQHYSSIAATSSLIVLSAGYSIGVDQALIKKTYFKLDGGKPASDTVLEIFIPRNESFSLIKMASIDIAQHVYMHYRRQYIKLPWLNVEIAFTLRYIRNFEEVKERLLKLNHVSEKFYSPSCLEVHLSYMPSISKEKLIKYCTDLYSKAKISYNSGMKNPDFCISKLASRYAVHFGYKFEYTINNVIKLPESQSIPTVFDELIQKLMYDKIVNSPPNQITINFYEPGDGIRSHVDVHSCFGEKILCLSLCSGIMMGFKDLRGNCFEQWLGKNSLLVMRDELRYEWKHGIVSRQFDMMKNGTQEGEWESVPRTFRVSITLRHVKGDHQCACKCFELCDVKNPSLAERDHFKRIHQDHSKVATDLERVHVLNFYDEVAEHFAQTRRSPWKKVSDFLSSLEDHSVVYDIGCGNGKYMRNRSEMNLTFIGSDSSINLLALCRKQHLEVFQSNALNLPLRSGCSDHTLCIAVLHHISTADRRRRLISELIRITKPSGRILLSVWCDNIDDNKAIKKAIPIESTLNDSGCIDENQNLIISSQNDYLVPWTLRNNENEHTKLMMRYIHLFNEDDIRTLIECFSEIALVESIELDHCNWFVTLCKL